MRETSELPPEQIEIPAAWVGEDMAKHPEKWLVDLEPEDVAELEAAATGFLAGSHDIGSLTKAHFPFPRLAGHLAALREKLIAGIGFEVLRGLPVERYSAEMTATIFRGVGAHLGSARSQNAQGHILGHVRDIGADAKDPRTRIYQTSERQTFHTDSADVVGLLCLRDAMQGGESLLVSTVTIYNEMRKRRPDLVRLLFDPIATDRRGEIPEGEKPYFEIPVLNWHAGLLTGIYQRQYIDSAQRFADAMRLTPAHVEALDLFDSLANDVRLNLSMRLRPGDMQFVYNHSLLHDRMGFRDWPDPDKRRHMLRLWLSVPGDRPLPDCFRQRYGSIEIGNRGGITVKGARLNVPLL
ncbi:putative taurine catabolism dioxygenase [Mesorhizobium australicum WSM2073]|uniref:Putative taurine catabolism dioxygenase n=1 Tax=Mesorhizobium australicum (strain HAMBI 3006 / LMG 24608 / WSM2073) TaxID=754035 RepID=L0KID2_MESAW|nr:TauD/TfdA family dioxygenase [Mesorhizobium australicum]AGB44771.1 putative taurine catabolism dioxygenase [Mesorhizobium australicum WSM2073]